MDHIEALLYEHAPRARELWLSTLPDRDDVPEHTFSRRFERRMAKLLRRQRRSPQVNRTLLVLRRTVAAVLVLLSVSFAGLMTVEAFRERVIQVVVQVFEELSEFRFNSNTDETTTVPDISFAYLPDGMNMITCETFNNLHSWYLYEDTNGYYFDLRQSVITKNTRSTKILDTEDAVTENWSLRGNDVFCATKNGESTLLWSEGNVLYTLSGNISLDELKCIASQITFLKE